MNIEWLCLINQIYALPCDLSAADHNPQNNKYKPYCDIKWENKIIETNRQAAWRDRFSTYPPPME